MFLILDRDPAVSVLFDIDCQDSQADTKSMNPVSEAAEGRRLFPNVPVNPRMSACIAEAAGHEHSKKPRYHRRVSFAHSKSQSLTKTKNHRRKISPIPSRGSHFRSIINIKISRLLTHKCLLLRQTGKLFQKNRMGIIFCHDMVATIP